MAIKSVCGAHAFAGSKDVERGCGEGKKKFQRPNDNWLLFFGEVISDTLEYKS